MQETKGQASRQPGIKIATAFNPQVGKESREGRGRAVMGAEDDNGELYGMAWHGTAAHRMLVAASQHP
jgi:hypothetical protein